MGQKLILTVDLYEDEDSGFYTDNCKNSEDGVIVVKKGSLFSKDTAFSRYWPFMSNNEYHLWFQPYKKTPKPLKLYNVELHQWDKDKKTNRHVSTHMWNSPYRLCKWKISTLEHAVLHCMNFHRQNWDHPDKGFYYKIVPADKKK